MSHAVRAVATAAIVAVLAPALWAQAPLDRTVLPIPEPSYPTVTELDARNAKAPPRFDIAAPRGAPATAMDSHRALWTQTR